jgi:hypothetical protein
MIKERLKFYADTPRGQKNKFFCWEVTILSLEDSLNRFFLEGYAIRAAWYEMINTETGEHFNERIKVQEQFDKFCDLYSNNKKIKINGHINGSN